MFDGTDVGGPWVLLTGAMLLVSAWFLWRGHFGRRPESTNHAEAEEVRRRADVMLQNLNGERIRQMEIRLHETTRDVQANIEYRMAILDRLVEMADDEIDRLESTLRDARAADGDESVITEGVRPFLHDPDGIGTGTPDERRMARLLHDSGYTTSEIACVLDVNEDFVVDLLDDPPARAA